ncbi:augmin complex subunit dgt3 [Zeugodacus cucurbitae]|uniref:augmin complex subunit dgt3 n=1 Tax=Zeugodacus cucurbitae TaxID=28588 RepID=UPI0023D908F6|nr:augmin complex subunit dgt3 [Zeugodacus cucurbitae]
MGDLINHFDAFKKLGFDCANQWILYDDRFQKFFNFFTENITDVNILTEHEVLEYDELKQRGELLEPTERTAKLKELEIANPGLLQYTEEQITLMSDELRLLEHTEDCYATLVEDMRGTKNKINSQLGDLENEISILTNKENDILNECQNNCRQLEEMQLENYKLCNEATRCFTKVQSPPLFIHQLPIDQYLLKCDTFMQYFTLYMKENFKIQDYSEMDCTTADHSEFSDKLQSLAKSMEYYTLKYIKEKAKAKATQSLIDFLDLSQIHVISLADMEHETRELEMMNEHHLKIAYDTLLNDLTLQIRQHTQQRMELILYENTKLKLERALKRQETDKRLTKIISDALSNAELVWIAIQLDLERKRNRFVNTDQLHSETDNCQKRIKIMRTIQQNNAAVLVHGGLFTNTSAVALLDAIAEQLSRHLGQKVRSEPKSCLYEYEKFTRLLSYAIQGLIGGKAYANVNAQMGDLLRIESLLRPMVYDSPVEAPMFEHVRFLMPIYNAKTNQERIDKTLRYLRTQFQENIAERLEKDKLWRYSQLLWIWFLTEPRRMIMAIEEAKKAASKVPTIAGMKSLSGIKRK